MHGTCSGQHIREFLSDKLYSKGGRRAAHQYLILRKKGEIVLGNGKKAKIRKPTFCFTTYRLPLQSVQELVRQCTVEGSAAESVDSPLKRSANFLAPTRDEYYRVHSRQSQAPPPGYYSSSDEPVVRRTLTPDFTVRPSTQPRGTRNSPERSVLVPEKPRGHVPGPVAFDKQLRRPTISSTVSGHFAYATSQQKRCKTPDFSKSPGRDLTFLNTSVVHSECSYIPECSAKVPNFKHYSERLPLGQDLSSKEIAYDPNYSAVRRRVYTPEIRKSDKPRSMPEYMCEYGSRVALNTLNEKMLMLNHRLPVARAVTRSRAFRKLIDE